MSYEQCWSEEEFIEEFDRRCRRQLGRRVARWDAESTWHPAHRNAHVRADLHRQAHDAGRAAWRAEVDTLASLGRPIPSAVVRHAWTMHEQRLRHATITPDELRIEHLDALRHLFDFTTTPVTFAPSDDDEPSHVPGLPVDQHLFLSNLDGHPSQTLDDFATAVADGTTQPGLYCLAGLPGSGKTTALRRIEWFARHRADPPVTLRINLGPSLDAHTFPTRLAADLCRSVLDHSHASPQCQSGQPNLTLFALGRIAGVCHRNLIRAIGLFICLAALCLYQSYSTDAPLPGWTYAVAVALISVLFFGSCSILSDFIKPALPAWPALLLVTFWPAAAFLCQSTGYEPAQVLHRTATAATFNPLPLAAFSLATIASVGVAILFLPHWWPTYAAASSVLVAVHRPVRGLDLHLLRMVRPYLSADGPGPDNPLASPGLQDLLDDCHRTFGGVVLLIDDADQLPIKDLQELLRLLRPLAKSPAVRTVLTVPRYLHAALHNGTFPDPHATIHHCLLIGDRYAHASGDGAFSPGPRARREFDEFLHQLLLSRLRIPLADPLSPTDAPLSLALSPWLAAPDAAREETLRHVHAASPTRRDLIRECEAVLLDPARRPFPSRPGRDLLAERDLLQRVRSEYPSSDRALPAEIIQRVTGTDTHVRLVPPPTDLPPARPLDAIPELDLPAYYVATPAARPPTRPGT